MSQKLSEHFIGFFVVQHIEIQFRRNLPEIEAIHKALRIATEIDVLYDKEKWLMTNPYDVRDSIIVYQELYSQITITVGHLETTYLMGVCLRVLQEMGGICKEEIPIWSIYTWEEYKKFGKAS